MITEFRIDDYKKFRLAIFSDLSRVNIILGNNNVGKTTILEAIYSFTCGFNLPQMLSTSNRVQLPSRNVYEFMEKILNLFGDRSSLPLRFLFGAKYDKRISTAYMHTFTPSSIFADLEPSLMGRFGASQDERENIIKLNKSDKAGAIGVWEVKTLTGEEEKRTAIIPYPFTFMNFLELNPSIGPLNSHLRSRFVDILSHRDSDENFRIYSFLKREQRGKLMGEFVSELSKTFTNISGIDCLPYPNGEFGPISFLTQDHGLIPIYNFGEGMQRWFNILGGMVVYQDAIHCIEEIDATFHPEAQKELAKNLVHYAKKYNNQLFLTSHSLEFVDTLLESLYGSETPAEDNVRIITLRNDPKTGEVKSRVLTGQEAYESREKYRMELR